MTTSKPPAPLGNRGAAYWRSVTTAYGLTTSECELLLEICRTLDNLDALAESVTEHGATVAGSAGQPVVNPALTEARGQRVILHRLIAALALPDPAGATIPSTTTTRARTAARTRWRGHVKDSA